MFPALSRTARNPHYTGILARAAPQVHGDERYAYAKQINEDRVRIKLAGEP